MGYVGGIAVLNGTVVQPGTTATGRRAVGLFEARADNSGGVDGAIRAKVRRGTFGFKNSAAADEITLADVGNQCFIVDDETVAETNGSDTRSAAGIVRDVDAQGVWVEFRSETIMLINNSTLSTLDTAFKAAFQNAFDQAATDWEKVATRVPSTTSKQEYGWLGNLPGMREWIGDRHVHGIAQHGYTIANTPLRLPSAEGHPAPGPCSVASSA